MQTRYTVSALIVFLYYIYTYCENRMLLSHKVKNDNQIDSQSPSSETRREE